MKELLLKSRLALGLLAAFSPAAAAQDLSDYTHTVSAAVYTPLPAAADVLAAGDDAGSLDDQTFEVSLPFDFSYNGALSSTVYVNTNGFIAFGGDCTFATPVFDGSSDAETGIIAACNADLLGASASATIRTGVTGIAPYRAFVIEWGGMDEWNNYVAPTFDPETVSLNFQIVLYEQDGIPDFQSIDINYGEMSVSEDVGVSVGLRYGLDVNLVTSASGWAALAATTNNMDQVPLTASVMPGPGMVITFAMAGEPLPVMLKDIAARNDGGENIVTWVATHQERGDRYSLERSGNGKDFQQVYEVTAAEAVTEAYTYRDISPLAGINYYRVRIVNNNQAGFYSNIVTARVTPAEHIALSPNPAENMISISGLTAYVGGRLSVINAIGQTVRKIEISRDNEVLDISALAAGTYCVSVEAGSLSRNARFIRR